MARQKTKISDRFKSGGDKDGTLEEKFFNDPDIQIDQEYKVIDLLKTQLDEVTEVVNANDSASGSYADLKNVYTESSASFAAMSGSLSTRVTTNDAKTGITALQANAITANTAKVSSPFPAITTKQAGGTITITGLAHTPAASDDAKDTLAISVQIVVGKTKTIKTFTLTAN